MKQFFHGWRRKAGLVTLVMACVVATSWVRSLQFCEQAWCSVFSTHVWLNHHDGHVAIILVKGDPHDDWGWQSLLLREVALVPLPESWLWESRPERTVVAFPHWAFAVPSALLSAYLLLGKPQKREEPRHE